MGRGLSGPAAITPKLISRSVLGSKRRPSSGLPSRQPCSEPRRRALCPMLSCAKAWNRRFQGGTLQRYRRPCGSWCQTISLHQERRQQPTRTKGPGSNSPRSTRARTTRPSPYLFRYCETGLANRLGDLTHPTTRKRPGQQGLSSCPARCSSPVSPSHLLTPRQPPASRPTARQRRSRYPTPYSAPLATPDQLRRHQPRRHQPRRHQLRRLGRPVILPPTIVRWQWSRHSWHHWRMDRPISWRPPRNRWPAPAPRRRCPGYRRRCRRHHHPCRPYRHRYRRHRRPCRRYHHPCRRHRRPCRRYHHPCQPLRALAGVWLWLRRSWSRQW